MKVVLCVLAAAALASARTAPGVDALYDSHQWFELQTALRDLGRNAPPLYVGAIAAAFGDQAAASNAFEAVFKDTSDPDAAYDAHQWMAYLYIRSGKYQDAAEEIRKKWAIVPSGEASPFERALVRAFEHIPDQEVVDRRPSTLHTRKKIGFVPLSLNGRPAEYFFDSDANLSFMSESDARRYGLTIRDSAGQVFGAAGRPAPFRTALAGDVVIGATHLKNVLFLVLADTEPAFSSLPPGERGALGLPVMLALKTIRLKNSGDLELGFDSRAESAANLCFDGTNLITQFGFADRKLDAVVDTGAVTTELWPPFATQFADLVRERGAISTNKVHGFGGTTAIREMLVPDLPLEIGGARLSLHPAHVLLSQTTPDSKYYFGRLGLDLIRQAREVVIDFAALHLSFN